MFLLRASELDDLELRDIAFGGKAHLGYVRIFIRKSKNDQDAVGVFRSLNANNATLCPVARAKNGYLNAHANPKISRFPAKEYLPQQHD